MERFAPKFPVSAEQQGYEPKSEIPQFKNLILKHLSKKRGNK